MWRTIFSQWCLADNDAQRQKTQNRRQREYNHDPSDLQNTINDIRHLRARTSSPQRRSPVQAPTPSGRSTFYALAPELKQDAWLNKFKPGPIDKYDGSSNPEEFIQVYRMVNYLPTALSSMARSWLVNLAEGTIYNWGQLCATFIDNFQGTYGHPSIAETLNTMKQKHDESL
jgi:hypothetical protein